MIIYIAGGVKIMSMIYMAIDKDINVHNKERQKWNARGVSDVRVDSMNEGIEKALTNQFFYIAINADNINYMPSLEILREATNDPILIGASNFTVDEQIQAINLGADFYGKFGEFDANINIALAIVNKANERGNWKKSTSSIISFGDILISRDYHKAFIKETEIFLNKTEMKVLSYFMVNRGRVLTYEQISRELWPNEYGEASFDALYNIMKRLRGKLRNSADNKDYIENIRDIGYRLST